LVARIPAAVGQPSAVAAKQADGSLFTLPYDTQTNGDWTEVKFSANTPETQIEYYDTRLDTTTANRHYEYQYPADYAVDMLRVQVQKPVGTQSMTISPSLGSGSAGSDGLTYYSAELGSMPASQPFSIKVDYTKTSAALSVQEIKPQPSQPISSTTTGRIGTSTILVLALAALGVLLIAGGGIWYWQSGRVQAQPAARRAHRRSTQPASQPPVETVNGAYIYCHQCGKRAAPGDRFCRTCGAGLRGG
jgi:hypothetical protein